jgi:MFS family permease
MSISIPRKADTRLRNRGRHIHTMMKDTAKDDLVHEKQEQQPQRSLDEFLENAYESENHHGPIVGWKYWAIMLSLGVANSSDASEILCISYILSDDTFASTILYDASWRAGLVASAVFLGMLLGGLCLGTLGDWVGRKPILLLGLCVNAVAGILSAGATNVYTLSLLRCLSGVGIGATVPPLFTLVTELAPPSKRGLFVTLCASFWMVGSLYVATMALAIFEYLPEAYSSWRLFALACAVPSAAGALLVYTLVPESPRFLAVQQRQPQALKVVNRLASQMKYHGPPLTLPELLGQFPSDTNEDRSSVNRFVMPSRFTLYSICGMAQQAMTDFWISAAQLYTPELKQTTWPLQMVWFSLSFGSYGLLTWINTLFVAVHLEDVYFNAFLFALSNLPGNILTALLMDRVKRSTMLVGSILCAGKSCRSSVPPRARFQHLKLSHTHTHTHTHTWILSWRSLLLCLFCSS